MWEHFNFSTSLPVVVSAYLFGYSRPSGVKWYFTGDSHQTSRAILVGLPQGVWPFRNQSLWSILCYLDQTSVMNSIPEICSDQVASERRSDSKFKIKVRTRIRRARCWQEEEWMSNEAQQPGVGWGPCHDPVLAWWSVLGRCLCCGPHSCCALGTVGTSSQHWPAPDVLVHSLLQFSSHSTSIGLLVRFCKDLFEILI